MKVSRAKCKRGTVKHERIPLLNPEAALLLRKKGASTHLLHKVVEVKLCQNKNGDLLLKKARVKKGRPTRTPMAFDPDITPPGRPSFSPPPMRSPASIARDAERFKTFIREPSALPSPRPAPPISPSMRPTPVSPSMQRMMPLAPAPRPMPPPPGVIVGGAAASGEPMRRITPPRVPVRSPPGRTRVLPRAPVTVDTSAISPGGMNGYGRGLYGLGCGWNGLGCTCSDGSLSCGCCG